MTYGPLPPFETASGRETVRGDVPGRRDLLALAGLLLEYPDDELDARRQEALAAAQALPDSESARHLVRFARWFAAQDADELRRAYVQTFDHTRRNALYATYATYGDTRGRGAALAALRELYAGAGFQARADELPDYLPTVLEFAAFADDESGQVALAQARPGVEVVARSLRESGSGWASLLDAVLGCLPPADAPTQHQIDQLVAAGPPVELVGALREGDDHA